MCNRSTRSSLVCIGGGLIMLLVLSLGAWALDDNAMLDSARAKMSAGDLTGAQAAASALLEQFPLSPEAPSAQLMLADIKLKTTPDDTQDLLSAYSLVRSKYPTSPEAADALVHIGFLHSRSDDAQSQRDFESFIESYPNHPARARICQSLGRLYVRTRNLDKAEATFDKLKAIPNAPAGVAEEAALQSGFVKIMRFYADKQPEHLAAAIQALSTMTSSKSAKVKARAELGVAESTLLLGKTAEAREKYSTAVQSCSTQPYFKGIALYGMACCSQMAGDHESAVRDYAALLAAQAGSSLSEKNTSWKSVALASTTANAQAVVQKGSAWERVPASDIIYDSAYNQAKCLYRLHHYDEAAKTLPELINCLPLGSETRTHAENLLQQCRNSVGGDR